MGAEWWSTSNDTVGGAIVRELTMLPTITAVFIFLVFEGATVGQPAMEKPLQLESKIPLGSVAGRIDHMAFDPTNHRLFVAELGNNTVGVVDLDAQKVVHRISGLKEPQGVAYVSKNDTLYVANGGNGSVQFFSGEDYSMAGQINLDADADNIRVDFSTNHLRE